VKQINEDILIAEKYTLVNNARISEALNPKLYDGSYFNFLEYTKNYPDQEEFIDWLYSELDDKGEIENWFNSTAFLSTMPTWEKLCYYYDARVQIIDEEEEDDYEMTDNDYEVLKKEIDKVKIEIDKYYKTFLINQKHKKVKNTISKNDQSGWNL